jgi:hypothetical protein
MVPVRTACRIRKLPVFGIDFRPPSSLRHPVLHGSLLDFRSFLYRIRLLWKRGGTRSLRIGWVYQQRGAQQGLALNRETQARSMGMQQLLFDCPWLSSEDCHLWLIGWNAGREWRESLGTAENNDDRRDS